MDEHTASVWMKLIGTVGRVILALVIGYFAFRCIEELAGKQTEALLEASLQYGSFNYALLAGLGLTILWGLGERRLRQRQTVDLTDRIQSLEQEKDPNRSSSHLTADGKTNPRDKL